MSDQEVRAGIQQAKQGEYGLKVISVESVIAAAVAGGLTRSWEVGILVFMCVLLLASLGARSEKASVIISCIMGFGWAIIAAIAMKHGELSGGAKTCISIFAMMVGIGLHYAGFQALRDMGRAKG
jgi:hypothetical protein